MNRRAFLHLGAVCLAACVYLGTDRSWAMRAAAQALSLGMDVPTEIPMQVGATPPGWIFPQPETPTPEPPTVTPEPPTATPAPVYRQYFPEVSN